MIDRSHKVYFAKCIGPNGEPIGAYKIGCSSGWNDRIKQVASGLPFTLEIEALVSGYRVMEKICHLALKEHRISGEYFHASDRVVRVVKFAAENGRAFGNIVESGVDTLPDGALKGFMDYHGVTLADACGFLGFPPTQYDKRAAKPGYRSSTVVAAVAIVASRKKDHWVSWPTDAIRGLCGGMAPAIQKLKAAAA